MTNDTPDRPLKGKHFADTAKAQNPELGRFATVSKAIRAAIDRTPITGGVR